MNRPLMETMEPRLLLSAGVLSAGQTEVFDLDGNGVNDAVLANLGAGDLEYEYSGGSTGFDVIRASQDGAAFRTNTWVASVEDTSATDDFDLTKVLLQKRTKFGGVWYDPVLGDSGVSAGAIDFLELGAAGTLQTATTEGDLLKLLLRDDATLDISSAGKIGTLCGFGDVSGSIQSAGDFDVLSADDLLGVYIQTGGTLGKLVADNMTAGSYVQADALGQLIANVIDDGSVVSVVGSAGKIQVCTMEDMSITTGGDLNCLCAGTITGSASYSSIAVGGHMNHLCANVITGGVNGMLDISVGAGLDKLCVGLLSGGQAVDGGYASLSLSVIGELDVLCAGRISGGQADAGGFAMLNFGTQNLEVGGEIVEYGNLGKLHATGMSGGEVTDGGETMLLMNVGYDLQCAHVGQMTGSGAIPATADPSIFLTVGHDIVTFTAGDITAGSAGADGAYAAVQIIAGNDIHKLSAGRIDGGTADGAYSTTEVRITAGGDIHCLCTNLISGGSAGADGASTGVYIDAGGDIGGICAGAILGGQADGLGAQTNVSVRAGNDIRKLCSGFITGGTSDNGASSYVNIVAEHDLVHACVGTILGSSNHFGGCDPAVQIQAYNDIKCFTAWQIIAGQDGLVNILAGIDGDGNISGDDGIGGSIEFMSVCCINGMGGEINIAAGGDIDYLQACCILSGDGDVNVIAAGDITVTACHVNGWIDGEETGVEFAAGGEVNDLRGTIRDEFITEGEPVELPTPI
ncbi:MAG: LEPR-XLL domain-containing protein [Phycisphaerae bacterium]|nr:LEPR-XLL domain-containing protein [Phycisphaerae bacterium]